MVGKLIDVIQETNGVLKVPEIRVWVHPFEGGDDFYYVFETFVAAQEFCDSEPGAESCPLIAYGGFEYNIYDDGENI